MQRTVFVDKYFDKQPPKGFVDLLKEPVHQQKPAYYGKRDRAAGEVDARGIYLANQYPDDPEGLLDTVYQDFSLFTQVYGIGGNAYPIELVKGNTGCFESYTICIGPSGITLTAGDTEGIRRGIIHIEDKLRAKEAAFLDPGEIRRSPQIKSRITRCFFSPINRPPKYGDELSDDIDYYPEEYLNRLMHDGTNGVWIYTHFTDLCPSEFILENGDGWEAKIAKLNTVVQKCRRYGIGVYLFAVEPIALSPEQAAKYPELAGAVFHDLAPGCALFCCGSSQGKAYCFEQGRHLAENVPGLRGFICITAGERFTNCAGACDWTAPCPRCGSRKRGFVLAEAVEALRAGFHSVDPNIEVVSWTYGHGRWEESDIHDYVEQAPDSVFLMQNFDDMGVVEQLGKERLGVDYWLSYAGPSHLFETTAQKAMECNKRMFAKMQVCCSHEIASIPYIPTPGLLFEKYKGAFRYQVQGILQCWYFGNYPSLMSKAAGEMSFREDFSDKHSFLKELAAIFYGQSKAETVAQAYEAFEKGYVNYPLNIMFSYYGPAHDGVVWELALKPKNFSLPRSWQTLDPPDGDRISEALMTGHTLEEALTLFESVCEGWRKGLKALSQLPVESPEETDEQSVASCVGLLFESTRNILEFYLLRDLLGRREGSAPEILSRMRDLVRAEMDNSQKMIPLCEKDPRLGYHSEGEGYKFFPERLRERIEKLEQLLATEFVEVGDRIQAGLAPLEYYEGVEDCEGLKTLVMSRDGIEKAEWEEIDPNTGSRFRMACDDAHIYMELESREKESFLLCPEYRLMTVSADVILGPDGSRSVLPFGNATYYELWGSRTEEALWPYRNLEVLPGVGTHLMLTLSLSEIGLDRIRPMKLRIASGKKNVAANGTSWIQDKKAVSSLGKNTIRPSEFGWIL